jgi:hypothetical protein
VRFEPICVAPPILLEGSVVVRVCTFFACVQPLLRQEEAMPYKIAFIDVHKKVLMVVVIDAATPEETQA